MAKQASIAIPAIDLRVLPVTIYGVTPLLVNRLSADAEEQIASKAEGKASKKKIRVPEEIFNSSQYVIDGEDSFPTGGIKKALVDSAQFGGQWKTTLRGVLHFASAFIKIEAPKPVMVKHTGRIPTVSSHPACTIYRAQYWPWQMALEATYNAAIISEEQIAQLVALAGFHIGIGAWRPEKNGTFGRFTVEKPAARRKAA
jgi:hypothetical protein